MGFKSPKYCIQFIYFAVLILISVHLVMQAGLSYVNKNGCQRAYLASSGNLTGVYQSMYNELGENCQVLDPDAIVV